VLQHPARAVVALHSDGSQSLISGRGGVAVPGGSASRAILGSQHENHSDTAAAP